MKEKDSDDEEDNYVYKEMFAITTYKVILVGESGVGKTCIMKRFVNNEFKDSTSATLSASYVEKSIELKKYNGKKINFGIWDTVGQEKYRSIAKTFFQKATAAIIVYDITLKSSFEEIKKFWYNLVINSCPHGINKSLYFFNHYYFYNYSCCNSC